ncbi:MAG: ABC transporter ATP-binding protein [Dehalococcoidia bacterium]
MLKIEDLKVRYDGEPVLRGINLEVADGECLAIIGESGAGKTTLGLTIMGLVNGNPGGRVFLDDTDVLSLDEDQMRKLRWNRVSMAFQSARNQLNPTHRIIDQVAEPMIAHGFQGKSEARERAAEILRKTGLPANKSSHYPHQLSGGEQQRVLIAMALANNSPMLILDEPISSLDASSRSEMLSFLRKALAGRAVMITTHDLSTASQLSSRVATLYGGRLVEVGPTDEVFSQPRHPYTRALLRSYPNMTTVKDLQGIKGRMDRHVVGCPFNPRCTQAINVCRESIPPLREYEGRLVACHRGGIIAALSATGMSKSFGQLKAVDDVSLTLDHGETLALVGQSGSGKTTLARLITGILEAENGEVLLEEQKVHQHNKDFHKTVQMVFQDPGEALSHRLTVLEAVREPLEVQGVGNGEERDRMVRKIIEEVELPATESFLDEYPHHLSGGELQRVNIARALVLNPKVLIADEPTAFLDSSVQAKILKLLLNLQESRGLSMLFITHDIAVARKISDRIAVMQQGRIVEKGPANLIVMNPSHPYTRSLLEAASELHSGMDTPHQKPPFLY